MATLAGKLITQNGLGLAGLTNRVAPTPDDAAFDVMRTALKYGANVWNGADFYGTPEANSLHLLNRYFTKFPKDAEKVVLCIKSGVIMSGGSFNIDCSAEGMRKSVDNANRILDGKKIVDVFGPARVDPSVPIETTIKALGQLMKEGKIGGIQLSEVRADTIRRASKVHKIDMVEAEVSLWATDIFSNSVAQTCAELGIIVLGHTPLGGGMLTGNIRKVEDMPASNHHKHFPRFEAENFQKNLQLVEELKKLAGKKGCTTAQLALSWIKSHNGKPGMPWILPIAGARSGARIRENCETVKLSEDEVMEIKSILDSFPVAGARYPERTSRLAEY
ncbi:Aldo/keto reductase [Stipitochalara longipes BDJ]|nr:Aldo/keto reductase [Stipitochalara longipes BDJ]